MNRSILMLAWIWLSLVLPVLAQEGARYSLATFVAETTPPVGHTLSGNLSISPVVKVVDPLFAQGFVLLGAGDPIVLVSVDWCGIGNDAHDLWRSKLAAAAGTTFERVLVCSIHQHDAPFADLEAERLFAAQKLGKTTLDVAWHEQTIDGVAAALAKSLGETQPVTHIGTGEAQVERVASNRRVFGPDGKVALVRYSAMKDEASKAAPEGVIDPWLKTLSFWNGDKPLASLSVYATHPMSFYGKGEVSSDFAGLARRMRQADDPGVLHFYANGCGGNLTAGKYNDGSPAARIELTTRLHQGWKTAWERTKKRPLDAVTFRSIPYRLDPKETAGFQQNELEALLTSEKTPLGERVRASYALSWRKRCAAKPAHLDLPVLDLGGAQLLLLPGEPFVEYQLFAQEQRPDSFVLTLGYGDYGPTYIPYDKAFAEGGYEPGAWSFVGVGVEQQLKDAIAKGLAGEQQTSLAVEGKTSFAIVTTPKPSVEETTAALWLSETLEQVTGAKFPIRADDANDLPTTTIRVAADPQLRPEEWRIRTVGESLILAGGRPRGTIYAVCEFLETHVGVLRLDPFTEFVPKQPTLRLPPLDRRGRPVFEFRSIYTGFPYVHPAPRGVNGERFRAWNKEHSYASLATGDQPRMVPDGVHTFGRFLSAKEFAKDHPEYFSMDADGKRMTDDKGQPAYWIQLCVTNKDVRNITLERALKMLRDDLAEATKTGREPARLLVLSQNDNTANLCLCPECKRITEREGSESGPLLEYVNHVARGLRDEFPNVTVLTEAYNFTLTAPRTIRPEPNVMIRYCDNYGLSDMTRPLSDPRNAERLALLDGWRGIGVQSGIGFQPVKPSNRAVPQVAVSQEIQGRQAGSLSHALGIWDYWRTIENHSPGAFAPSSNVRAMYADMNLFRQRGVRFLSAEIEDFMGMGGLIDDWAVNDVQSFLPLRAWLGMKLADDPTRNLDATLDRFFNGYYGNAATPMRGLLDLIEERQSRVTVNSSDRRRHVWLEALCDAEYFAGAYRHLDAATAAAAQDSAALTHVLRERIVIDSAFLWTAGAVRRNDPATAAKLPQRTDVIHRHRSDWTAYLKSIYNAEGLAIVTPMIEKNVRLIERLTAEDTDAFRVAVAVAEKDITLDGKLTEPFWKDARTLRLLPRDPKAANDDASAVRFAWTADALYVAIQQPQAAVSSTWEVALMAPDRQGVQMTLHAQPSGTVSAYFYRYPATGGMETVPGRKTTSRAVSTTDATTTSAEIRIPWMDLSAEAKPASEFLLNVGVYPKPDSKTLAFVSSPWLIGNSPTYNPLYFATVQLSD